LLVFERSELLDDLLRLAAAACVEPEVARDAAAAREHWSAAPLVVMDAGAALSCEMFPRRDRVVVVTDRADDSLAWEAAAKLAADHVMPLPASQTWLVDRLAAAGAGPGSAGRVVSVVGGRGGSGATVLAAGLAVTAVRAGLRPLLVDADPLGGGIDLALGGENTAGLRWPDLTGGQSPGGRLNAPSLLKALPRVGELCVLSWDRSDVLAVEPAAVRAVLEAGRRGRDLVVVDLPRRADESMTVAVEGSDTVLLMVPADVRGCAAAARMVKVLQPHCSDLRVIVRGPAPAGLKSRDLGRALGLPLAGVLRPEAGLAAALDRGEPPAGRGTGPIAEICRSLLSSLELLPLEAAA
jgi:secretion/DNA translocation related CpaE-like protein